MSEPVWITCESVGAVPPTEVLLERASAGRHVVLMFPPALPSSDKLAVMEFLASALPDHRVFESGGDPAKVTQITVKPVVSKSRVLKCWDHVIRAIKEYRTVCVSLVQMYESGTLPQEWETSEHGGHVMFKHNRTGQVVEAPFREWVSRDLIDPYFFALFVRSTSGLEPVAELIQHNYHDAARILEVVDSCAPEGRV